MKIIVGIDFGNVIKLKGETTPIHHAKEAIAYLASEYPVYLISKVNDQAGEDKVKAFLQLYEFNSLIKEVFFCRKRDEKAGIAKRLEITHFIDDRTEVLSYMESVPHRIAFNPTEEQLEAFPPTGMTIVHNWKDILKIFI